MTRNFNQEKLQTGITDQELQTTS